jgi:phosphatidylglycerol---prolipoprotein diacylglyceryl transferase
VITINIDPIIFQIGPVAVRWYGLMYVVGFMVGMWVAGLYAPIRRITEDDLWYLFWPSVIAGLLGARIYYVLQSLDRADYLHEPWRVLATWEGGMAFYGAVFAIVPTIFIAARRRGMDVWSLLDAAAFFAVIGQAIGRIGNIINGDIVGFRTDLPWGFAYIHPNSFVPLSSTDPGACVRGVPCQPAAVYELLFNLVLFLLMWRMRNSLRKPGSMFTFWLVGYSIGQIVLFTMRANDVLFLGLKQAQITAIVVILACIPLAWYLSRRATPEPVAETPVEPEESGDDASPDAPAGSPAG